MQSCMMCRPVHAVSALLVGLGVHTLSIWAQASVIAYCNYRCIKSSVKQCSVVILMPWMDVD